MRFLVRSLPPRPTHRVLELQQILNTLWGIIREPIKLTLTDGVCRSTNALAKNFELANFDAIFFPDCNNGFNYTAGANAVFAPYTTKMSSGLMTNLAKFHDFDEALLNAWKDSGIETGLNILYDAITEYDDLMTTITNVFEGTFWGDWQEETISALSINSYALSPCNHTRTQRPSAAS